MSQNTAPDSANPPAADAPSCAEILQDASGESVGFRYVDPRWEAALPLFSWGGLLSPVFWAGLAISMSVALFVPEEFARNNAWASEFAATVRSAFLSVSRHADINEHARTTAFPYTALLSHAVMWSVMASLFLYNTVASIIFWRYHIEWFGSVRPQLTKKTIKPAQIALGALSCVGGAAVFSMMPGSASILGNAELSSRAVFSVLTGIFVFLAQLFGSWLPLAVHLSRKQQEGKK